MYPILICLVSVFWGFPGGSVVKKSTYQCRRHGFSPWVGKIPWRRKWQPTPVVSPGKSHGQRSLVDYSLGGRNRVRLDSATKPTTTKSLFSGRVGCSLVFSIINNALLTFCLSASVCIYLLHPNLFSFHPNKLFLQL